jgi:hypothetical protein
MHGGMEDLGRDLVSRCVFEGLRLEQNQGLELGFQGLVHRVCSLVCVDLLQSIRSVTCVLPAGLALADLVDHLLVRALLAAFGDSAMRTMVETRPSTGRRPRRRAAGRAGGAGRQLRRELLPACALD